MIKSILNWLVDAVCEFWPEIFGFFLILCLILFFLRIRRKRRLKKNARQKPEPAAEAMKEVVAPPSPDEEGKDVQAPSAAEDTSGRAMPEPEVETAEGGEGFFRRLQNGLTKTRQSLGRQVETVFSAGKGLDEEALEQIEEALITADVGVDTTMALIERLSATAAGAKDINTFKETLKREMQILLNADAPVRLPDRKPWIILVVGVNGVGKTTTIGKLAARYRADGKKVILGAADTFRAAAVEQLEIWAKRADADIIKHRDKADPAAVAYDAVKAAEARDADRVIIDTAGRLHTKVNLMEQLKKVKRSISRQIPDAPHEILLVVDATTGQNAVSQAKLFHEGLGITGIALTKLDGTAKGGIVLAISHSLNIPIRYIGIGEKVTDLQEFDPQLFVDALL